VFLGPSPEIPSTVHRFVDGAHVKSWLTAINACATRYRDRLLLQRERDVIGTASSKTKNVSVGAG
jgi:hypothetical protein